MSDTSNLYNDMRNLIHFLPFICSGYPWRAIGNTLTVLQHRKYPIIHSLRSENVATDSKNKETIASLFFSRCQRSKVIFRVTQKALRDFLGYFRNHLALAGGSAPISMLPMVTWLMELWSNPSLHLPMVAFVSARPSVSIHSDFHNLKQNGYGK